MRESSREIAKQIFDDPHPEQYVRTVPAQTLYMIVKHQGLESAGDLILIATDEQCRTLLDLDLWQKDRFFEDSFWIWLELPDQGKDLALLQKFLKVVDLKLIALMIERHVEVVVHEDKTEPAPGEDFYSPDHGYTWIRITIEDSHRQFLLNRLLALLFETNSDLYYQILSVPSVATASVLEEESYQERSKRLGAEGIPDDAWAFEINSAYPESEAKKLLHELAAAPRTIESIRAVKPFVYDTLSVEPLGSLISQARSPDLIEEQLTLLTNAAIVHWNIPYFEHHEILNLIDRVKGALNIGIETVLELADDKSHDFRSIEEKFGMKRLYQLGLGKLFTLRNLARQVSGALEGKAPPESYILAVLEPLTAPFPMMPIFFKSDGTLEQDHEGKLLPGTQAISHIEELKSLTNFIST